MGGLPVIVGDCHGTENSNTALAVACEKVLCPRKGIFVIMIWVEECIQQAAFKCSVSLGTGDKEISAHWRGNLPFYFTANETLQLTKIGIIPTESTAGCYEMVPSLGKSRPRVDPWGCVLFSGCCSSEEA